MSDTVNETLESDDGYTYYPPDEAEAPPVRGLDEKGRPHIEDMTDREIAEETLQWLRAVADILEGMGSSPYGAVLGFDLSKLPGS